MKYLVKSVLLLLTVVTFVHSVLIVPKYDDEHQKSIHFDVKTSFKLECKVVDKDVVVAWEKDSKNVTDIASFKDRMEKTNNYPTYTFKLRHAVDKDTGEYFCVVYQKGVETARAAFNVSSNIAVKVTSNINVVEGEKLKITCNVVGKPYPQLSWSYKNETYNETFDSNFSRFLLEEDPEKHIPNAILRIEEVQMFDRGEFTCIGKSSLDDTVQSSVCMIRVKDKYAALWPFLGICAEVFILCAIIFIYEKKRNKTELEESDTDQSPDQKNTPDHGKDTNLRHRQ